MRSFQKLPKARCGLSIDRQQTIGSRRCFEQVLQQTASNPADINSSIPRGDMKTDIHPDYRPVVFLDTSSGEKFLTRSTVQTEETTEWEDGNTYPLAKIEISSASHPFFTGQMTIVDTAGRVERFERRYGKRRRAGSPEAKAEAEAKAKAEKAEAEAAADSEATSEES